MENATTKSTSHAVYALRLHLVFVTKYRRPALSPEILDYARDAFADVLEAWRCSLIEFGGEPDHVHLLIAIHPALDISRLINNLKTASSRRIRNRFGEHLIQFYWKPVLWHRAYYVASAGGAPLDQIKRYVAAQGTKGKRR